MISIAAVSYLNTKPFIEGLQHEFDEDELALHLAPPAECARRFQAGEVSIGLIPAASLLDLEAPSLLDRYCIGADGRVDTVLMLAQSPLHKLRELYLDPHSRTSNGLARVLFRRHWLQPVLVHEDIENHGQYIKGPAAGIAIGDKAHTWRQQYRYVWDLAEAWQAWSGLPFVFAVWAYDASIVSDDTLARLMNAFEWAQYNRAEVADRWAPEFEMSAEQARNYLTQALDFEFDTAKQIALKLYLKELAPLEGKRYPGQIQLASELLQVRSL